MVYSEDELARISPFLYAGTRSEDVRPRFVGTLNLGWDALDPDQRVEQATAIGDDLRRRGVESVLLLDSFDRIQAHYLGGRVVYSSAPEGGG